ncbi:Lrp/AsnC family transcriptional regulator [Salinibacterium sp. G-O1]|uniref:Lrp/AsnC family transcriptional regulator n=1 Tax=Salinibacterium sp. G-O1 TaxID=3046208 RepID=UPI0024B9E7F3|nr:Lrp/AsnC family transcriptional regulator [Salinibacterium sp. G-O1]MDJ0335894.1 Lrp/AsnC family transcriptional regulator [Salinibacterium sp. G-O1]
MSEQEILRPLPQLDDIDLTLVRLLRDDARMSNARLAEEVGIAASTCLTRVRSLIERGVVRGFHAELNPRALGLGLEALISVNIRVGARRAIAQFSDEMRQLPEVVQVFFLGGSEDFILHVASRDSDHIRQFVVDNLSAHPSVASTRTSLVFEHHTPGLSVRG